MAIDLEMETMTFGDAAWSVPSFVADYVRALRDSSRERGEARQRVGALEAEVSELRKWCTCPAQRVKGKPAGGTE